MENPSNQLIQAQLEAAVKSIHTFPESSVKSHIIEEKKKVFENFFTKFSNYEREDEDKTDDKMITIDSLLELYKVELGLDDRNLFSSNVGMTITVKDIKRLIPPNELNDEVSYYFYSEISKVQLFMNRVKFFRSSIACCITALYFTSLEKSLSTYLFYN
ncbi:uncharacterized protein LOC123266366 [Cotesia glomerata]|uniref:uncharacterized protein LOC123266366 n=1 Tax=Cotesia glomerata TaxID=32391 RepID=UPI001D032397|nr:uncharacterized protein LOC123266366 [Cotesia glomerata]